MKSLNEIPKYIPAYNRTIADIKAQYDTELPMWIPLPGTDPDLLLVVVVSPDEGGNLQIFGRSRFNRSY